MGRAKLSSQDVQIVQMLAFLRSDTIFVKTLPIDPQAYGQVVESIKVLDELDLVRYDPFSDSVSISPCIQNGILQTLVDSDTFFTAISPLLESFEKRIKVKGGKAEKYIPDVS